MGLRRYAKRHNHADLLLHARRVAKFGGRENQDAKVKRGILNANLGGSHKYDTTAVVPSDKVVVLCEMSLPKAIAVDLVFSLPNRRIDPDGGAKLADDPATTGFDSLDVGSGFVRITWGSNGGQVQSIDVDAGKGWRYPFIASYVSMAYHPVDRTQWVGTPDRTNAPIVGGQARNLIVSASIVPGHSTAPVLPLTKTMYYPDIGGLTAERMPIPNNAQSVAVRFRVGASLVSTIMDFFPAEVGSTGLGARRTNNSANQWPTWLVYEPIQVVPQQAALLELQSTAAATILQNVTAIYNLNV